jgi:hypothetical protein
VYLAILVPAWVTFVGYWLTRQAQDRSEKRASREHQDEVARLRLDAAMRAAALFGGAPGVEPNPTSSASGLLALTELGRADLAVALLVDLWADGGSTRGPDGGGQSSETRSNAVNVVSNETAVLVINAALQAKETPAAQLVAAELLCRNSTRLDPCQSLDWPAAIDGLWIPDLPRKAKMLVTEGLVRMTFTSPFNENALRSLVVRLYAISATDEDKRVKGCLGWLIKSLIPALERLPYTDFMAARGTVSLDEIRVAADLASPNPDGYMERVVAALSAELTTWSSPPCALTVQPGALAVAG